METEKLKEYLSIAVDMEKNIYLQQNIIAQLEEKIRKLRMPQIFVDPAKPTYPKLHNDSLGAHLLVAILASPVIWFVTALVAMAINGIVGAFGGNVEWLILLSVVTPVIFILTQVSEYKENNVNDLYKIEDYNTKYRAYQSKIQENEIKRQEDREQREAEEKLVLSELDKEEVALKQAKACLDIVYEKNVIFPKYRNFVMVSSLYEYICAGRCTALEGHEGAYNILEIEIRLDHIITQLDRVIAQLDAIKSNQYMVYSAIQDANRQSAQILESTNRMAESIRDFHGDTAQLNAKIAELQQTSAITAYHTERTQKELAYMNRMNYLTGRNDGPFWNVPPT